MKLSIIAFIILGCTTMKIGGSIKTWGVSTNYSKSEISNQDTMHSDNKLNLADAIYIEKYLLDSAIGRANYNSSFTIGEIDFQRTAYEKLFFQDDTLNLYKIYWNKDSTNFNDFSSFIVYTERYGVIFKSFRRKGKEFYRWRLKSVACDNNQIISFDSFTNKLLQDTIIFPKVIGLPN